MKYLLALMIGVASVGVAYAGCTTNTTTYNGRMVTCTTCCMSNGNCNTNCF